MSNSLSSPELVSGKKENTNKEDISGELWKLLRVGDMCRASLHGVVITGKVSNIIRLSNGRVLFSMRSADGNHLGSFDHFRVVPADADMVRENMTRLDLLLRRYEPKGMSTATAGW
jgi:hypothetical protein